MINKRNRFKIGLEIECVYNNELISNFNKGSYHDGRAKGRYWSLENDGSIRDYNEFPYYDTCEFVSRIFKSKKAFIKGLEEFKSFFNNYPLEKVLSFNKSCGCHFHIGLNNNKKYSDFLGLEELKKIRGYFFKSISESNILKNDTKKSILEHYFRDYARKLDKKVYPYWKSNRTLEFNRISEDNNRGLEWRSLNLNGVTTWNEFFEVMNIIYNCIEKMFNLRTKGFKNKAKKHNLLKYNLDKNLVLSVDSIKNKLEKNENTFI